MNQDLESNSKLMPVMCANCGHMESILYIHPHKFAGIFECAGPDPDCGSSWSCTHPSFHEEDHEVDTLDSKGEHTTYPTKILVCDDCETDCTEDKVIHELPDDDCVGCS